MGRKVLKLKIVVADDEKLIRLGLKKIIEEYNDNYTVCGLAANVDEAIEMIEKLHPNVVISDLCMPDREGFDLLEYINNNKPYIKHFVISGYEDKIYLKKCIKYNTLEYLSKPIDKSELQNVLDKIYTELCAEKNRSEEQLHNRRLLGYAKKHLIELIVAGNQNEAECEKLFKRYNISQANGDYVLIIVKTNAFGSFQEKWDNSEYMVAVENVMLEILENNGLSAVGFEYKQRNLLMVQTSESGDVLNVVKEAGEQLEKIIYTDLTMGISTQHKGIRELKGALFEAESALNYRLVSGNGKIYEYTNMPSGYRCDFEEINRIVSGGEPYEEFLQKAFFQNTNTDDICGNYDELINYFARVRHAEKSFKTADEFESATDMCDYIREMFVQMSGAEEKENKNISDILIKNIKKDINENYYKNISLEDMAKNYNISSQYLSTLFKKVTGQNFKDYIINVRIENAKILLASMDLKVYEIGNMVGYDNKSYFSKLFRKVVGMSPETYRIKILDEN